MLPVKLDREFIVLDRSLHAHTAQVQPALYEDLNARFDGFQSCLLIAEYVFDDDWGTWERHPHGDEILYLLSGAAEIHFLAGGRMQKQSLLQPGSAMIIRQACWHTAKVLQGPCRILFVTPGENTENIVSPPFA
ncbi:cupin domain-containing protein [Undibacterium griseum]|uniref:Cupin domain-containing protein n=1 Tax=Undibacterium griseum TaxID=2762295 RepID=A0ABR6YLS6_9BURK|nr:cupin domain-containing protein [Undibacterium griseum]MBC3884850.1 cupin domain-containing protein [Undibacterium griseum]